MAAIITKDTRTFTARQFVESVSESANNQIYMFIGKPDAWGNESAPDTPTDTYRTQVEVWDNMIALKKVNNADITFVIPRNNWTTGTRYNNFSDGIPASNLFASNFVIVTSGYNVYKCLQNANTTSSVEPSGTGLTANNLVYTADGYTWKYMYNIDPVTWLKFATTAFIPVIANSQSVASVNAANATGIYAYRIVSGNVNSGVLADNAVLTIGGDGSGASANVRVTSGNVTLVNVINPGSNYTVANITTNLGNAVIEPIISPPKGHGYDPVDELGGVYAMINVRLEQSDTDIPSTGAKFRQLGLIKDPYLFGTTTVANVQTLRAFSNITISGSIASPSTVVAGATLTGATTGANATVVSYSGNVINYVKSRTSSPNIIANFTNFAAAETIKIGATTLGSVATLGNAAVSQNSGEIIYIDNRNVISRSSDQVESLYVIVEF